MVTMVNPSSLSQLMMIQKPKKKAEEESVFTFSVDDDAEQNTSEGECELTDMLSASMSAALTLQVNETGETYLRSSCSYLKHLRWNLPHCCTCGNICPAIHAVMESAKLLVNSIPSSSLFSQDYILSISYYLHEKYQV